MVRAAPLTPRYEAVPYWWDDVELPQPAPSPLPGSVDVVVVGGGYTGLAAALEICRGGRHVVVLDRDDIGAGASSRNGGMAHPGGKHDVSEFLAEPDGRRLWDETVDAFEGVGALAAELGIEFDWQRCGHLELAHHPRVGRRAARRGRCLRVDRRGGPLPHPRRAGCGDRLRPVLRRAPRRAQRRAPSRQAGGRSGAGRRRGRGRAARGDHRPRPGAARAGLRDRDVARCAAQRARSWWRPTARPTAGSCRGWDGASSPSAAT